MSSQLSTSHLSLSTDFCHCSGALAERSGETKWPPCEAAVRNKSGRCRCLLRLAVDTPFSNSRFPYLEGCVQGLSRASCRTQEETGDETFAAPNMGSFTARLSRSISAHSLLPSFFDDVSRPALDSMRMSGWFAAGFSQGALKMNVGKIRTRLGIRRLVNLAAFSLRWLDNIAPQSYWLLHSSAGFYTHARMISYSAPIWSPEEKTVSNLGTPGRPPCGQLFNPPAAIACSHCSLLSMASPAQHRVLYTCPDKQLLGSCMDIRRTRRLRETFGRQVVTIWSAMISRHGGFLQLSVLSPILRGISSTVPCALHVLGYLAVHIRCGRWKELRRAH